MPYPHVVSTFVNLALLYHVGGQVSAATLRAYAGCCSPSHVSMELLLLVKIWRFNW